MANEGSPMTAPLTERPLLLTTRETAELLRMRPDRIYALVAQGVLDPVRLTANGRHLFRREDVERMAQPTCQKAVTSDPSSLAVSRSTVRRFRQADRSQLRTHASNHEEAAQGDRRVVANSGDSA
jgi:hypothetical protein